MGMTSNINTTTYHRDEVRAMMNKCADDYRRGYMPPDYYQSQMEHYSKMLRHMDGGPDYYRHAHLPSMGNYSPYDSPVEPRASAKIPTPEPEPEYKTNKKLLLTQKRKVKCN